VPCSNDASVILLDVLPSRSSTSSQVGASQVSWFRVRSYERIAAKEVRLAVRNGRPPDDDQGLRHWM
jgi:hypothetical protein